MRLALPLLVLFLFQCGCKKKVMPGNGDGDIVPPESTDSNVVWMLRSDSLGGPYDAREPLVWGNHLLWSEAPLGGGFSLHLSDGLSGQILWTWQDFLLYENLPFFNFHFISGATYCFNNIQETHSLDLVTGKSNWSHLDHNAGAYISGIGSQVYAKTQDRNYRPEVCILQRSSVDHKNWQPLLTIAASNDSGYSPAIFGPSLWLSPQGDSILIFQNRSYNFSSNTGKVDVHAYSLSGDSSLFVLRNIAPSGNSNVMTPLIDGDYAYLLGSQNIICVDLLAHSVAWTKSCGSTMLFSNLLISGEHLIVKPDDDQLLCLDRTTGATIWAKENLGSLSTPMVTAFGVVYYLSENTGTVYGIRISDGRLVMEYRTPNEGRQGTQNAKFQGGVAVNADLELLYVHDRYYVMAIKINQTR